MNRSLADTLVLCDLDNLLLGPDGNLTQVLRDIIQLYDSRGGRLTVFSQRTPKAVRALLGGVRLGAPALLCGGTLAYSFAQGRSQGLCSFADFSPALLERLPSVPGLGIAVQMADGATRVLRMSQGLSRHLHQEWTPYLLGSAGDLPLDQCLRVLLYQDEKNMPLVPLLKKSLAEDAPRVELERLAPDLMALSARLPSGAAMLQAVCDGPSLSPEQVQVVAGSAAMLSLVQSAGYSIASADAPAELRLAAQHTTLTDSQGGAAAEVLYRLVRHCDPVQ